jgi:hypothetical protein
VGSHAAELALPSIALPLTSPMISPSLRMSPSSSGASSVGRVYSASDKFPSGTAVAGIVIVASALPRRYIEVPRYDETISSASVEEALAEEHG